MKKLGIITINDNMIEIPNEKSKYTFDMNEVRKKMEEIWNNKPLPTFFFDQRPITLSTTIKRINHLLTNNDVYKKNIVFLGDDDLDGLALALTRVDCNITVLDIDERLINYINEVAKLEKLNINAYVYNALDKVPNNLKHTFDVLFTDPTPEEIPFTIFMNDAVNLVKKDTGVIYTSIYSSAMKKTYKLQEVITNMHLYIDEVLPRFTEYQAIYELYKDEDIEFMKENNIPFDNESICFTETQFRLEVTPDTKVIKISYRGSDLYGKATKRVIKDKKNDVANDEYIDRISEEITKTSDTIYISGDE